MFFSAMQYLAGINEEVSHDQLLTLMLTMFIAWPTLLLAIYGWISTRVRHRDRADDQQERAERDSRLIDANAKVAAVARKAHESAQVVNEKLDQIHLQGNSLLTKTMESERVAVEQALGAITEAIDMKLSMGIDVPVESYASQAQLDEQLEMLNSQIHARHMLTMNAATGSVASHGP